MKRRFFNDRGAAGQAELDRRVEPVLSAVRGPDHVRDRAEPPLLAPGQFGASVARRRQIRALLSLPGFKGACLMDAQTGISLATAGADPLRLEAEAQHYAGMVVASLIANHGMSGRRAPEAMLIHGAARSAMLMVVDRTGPLYLYVALDRAAADTDLSLSTVAEFGQLAAG